MAPQYTTTDLGRYMGFMLGTSGTFVLLEQGGVEQYWVRLAIAVVVGIGCGWLGEKLMLAQKGE